ncbi:MAG: hypothetical protein QM756_15925 [Polyangiaceae bacterium]
MSETRALTEYQNDARLPTSRLELRAGQFLSPVSFGAERAGAHGPGRVYFDGDTLYAASSDAASPALVDRAPLGCNWTAIGCPACLDMGDSRLVYGNVAPQPSSHWDVPTVVARGVLIDTVDAAPELFDAQVLTLVRRPAIDAAREIEPETTPRLAAVRRPSALRSLLARVRSDFLRAPRSVRLAVPVIPLAAWLALTPVSPPTSASPARATPTATPPVPREEPSPPPKLAELSAEPERPREPADPLEAKAVTALLRGADLEAAKLYDELARAHPNRSEFAVAARILRGRARP